MIKSIKNNIDISKFDDFLCKLEEREEMCCGVVCNDLCYRVSNGDLCVDYTGDDPISDGCEAVDPHENADGIFVWLMLSLSTAIGTLIWLIVHLYERKERRKYCTPQ